ncbi:MAG: hypothetical protein V2A62_00830 [Candidatus Woesearchaeota archaeon]
MVRRFDSKGYEISYLERRFPDRLNLKKTYQDVIKQVGIDRLEDLSLGERHDLLMNERWKRISEVAQQAKLEDTVARLEERCNRFYSMTFAVVVTALIVGGLGYLVYNADKDAPLGKFRNQVEETYHSIIEDTNAFLRENK